MSVFYDLDDYIKAKNNYLNTPGKIVNGKGFNLVDGEWIPDEEYYRHNSYPTYSLIPKANADSTHIASETVRKKST